MDPTALLAQSYFFGELSDESRRRLAECCGLREYRKRDVLFQEGTEGEGMYLLARGRVQLHKHAPDGSEVVIKVVRPGESFAEVVLFERSRHPVTAVALTDTHVFLFPRSRLRLLMESATFRDEFLSVLMRRLRYLTERVLYLTACDVEDRLRRFLVEQYGEAPVVTVTLSKRDIARAIGTTPETLSRVLWRMEREGTLSWKGRRLERPAPPAAKKTRHAPAGRVQRPARYRTRKGSGVRETSPEDHRICRK